MDRFRIRRIIQLKIPSAFEAIVGVVSMIEHLMGVEYFSKYYFTRDHELAEV